MSKAKRKIKETYFCPECTVIMSFDGKVQICPECWMKQKKKVKMQKGIFKSGWDKRIFRYNNLSLLEKLKNVLERNEGAESIKIDDKSYNGPFIFFTIKSFGSNDLYSIFHYWGLNWKDYVKEFRVHPTDVDFETLMERWNSGYYYKEENDENDDFYVRVNMWLHKLPDMLNCDHDFKERKDWGYKICCKCGLFEDIKEDKNAN